MFFMMLLFDEELEVSEKAQIYLEVLGNTQLCPKTFEVSSSFIRNKPILLWDTDPKLYCLPDYSNTRRQKQQFQFYSIPTTTHVRGIL